jgi:hypothetical protein
MPSHRQKRSPWHLGLAHEPHRIELPVAEEQPGQGFYRAPLEPGLASLGTD